MATLTDVKIANLGTGFTIGVGVWTIWTATKQTMAHRSPTHSLYLYMIWGEILANFAIALLAWLFLDGVIKPGVPIYFLITFFWVFEIQLLMQIIINRVAVVVNDHHAIQKIKWGTAAIMTSINIAVFIIWIPSQLVPPPIPILVQINKYWDRTSKGIILIVDAGLNLYFLKSVRKHLIKEHGLHRYQPLVKHNARLMVVSILMDVMLIALESIPNHGDRILLYESYHPVAYMVKLNIEMTMAKLIVKIAQGSMHNMNEVWYHTDGCPPEYYHNNAQHTLSLSGYSDQGLVSVRLPDWPIVPMGSTYTNATGPDTQGENASKKNSAANQPNGGIKINEDNDADISIDGITETKEERPRFGIGAIGRKFSFGPPQHGNARKLSSDSFANNEQKRKESASKVDDICEEDITNAIVRTTEVEVTIEEVVGGKLVGVHKEDGNI